MGFDRPVILACTSLHRCVVSSHGLEDLRIDANTPDPPGGRIHRDHSGQLTGLLIETAWSHAHAASLGQINEPDRYADLIEERATLLLSYGITAIHDTAMSPRAEVGLPATGRAGSVADLDPRVSPRRRAARRARPGTLGRSRDRRRRRALPSRPGEDLRRWCVAAGVRRPNRRPSASSSERSFRASTTTSAWRSLVASALLSTPSATLASQALSTSWRAATTGREPEHGIRVEHVLLASSTELDEMRRLGVTGVIQPGFVVGLGDVANALDFDEHTWLPFADLDSRGIPLAASSDSPCTDTVAPDPAVPIWACPPPDQVGQDARTGRQSLPLADVAAAVDGGSGTFQGEQTGRTRPDPPRIRALTSSSSRAAWTTRWKSRRPGWLVSTSYPDVGGS